MFCPFPGERLMPADHNLLLLATDFRVRAVEILVRAERMSDAGVRQMLRGIAAGYERLAQYIEQHSADAAVDSK
jgi:hypothetical protein